MKLQRIELQRIKPLTIRVISVVFALYIVLVQFTTSNPYIHLLPIPTPALLTVGLSGLLLGYWLFFREDFEQNSQSKKALYYFVFAFALSIIIAILSSLYTLNVIRSTEYVNYITGPMPQRVIYYATFLIFLYFGNAFFAQLNEDNLLRIVKIYPLSLFLLVAVGVWQLLYFLYNVPFLDIETRSYVHSVTGNTFFNFRLTSFADEPSYLGPLLIDMMILGLLVFKRKWIYLLVVVIPATVILLFSFAVSGYMNLLMMVVFVVVYLVFHPKFPKKYLWMILGLVLFVITITFLVKPELITKFLSPVLGRFDSLLNPQSSSRIYMYIMPIYWLFDHSIFSALFGYGPGSYEFLHHTKILPSKVNIAISSNNMYIDLLFEHGIIGLVLIVSALAYLFVFLWKKGRENLYYFIALMELTHVLITALYRADFVTPRFWTVFLLIFLLISLGDKKMRKSRQIEDGVNR